MESIRAKIADGLLCLIGDPVDHSLSPVIYNGFFREENINALYFALRVEKNDLNRIMSLLKRFRIIGFNVTMPHKISIVPLLDEIDPLAKLIKAVNTVVIAKDRLIGYNTDALGLKAVLRDQGFSRARAALLVGAGGYARAVAHAISDKVEMIFIVSKSGFTALNLASEIRKKYGIRVKGFKAAEAWSKIVEHFDIIVNASPVGLKNSSAIPLPPRLLEKGSLVIDAVYNPLETRLLREAKRHGCRIIDGLWLLSYQAAENIRLWFKQEADPAKLRNIALKAMKNA